MSHTYAQLLRYLKWCKADLPILALGYLLGPTLGSSLFALAHPKLHKGNPSPIELMDREFFRRIAKNRGDPRFQSVQNPAPDFYGEKVSSCEPGRFIC